MIDKDQLLEVAKEIKQVTGEFGINDLAMILSDGSVQDKPFDPSNIESLAREPEELKPCPFCGEVPKIVKANSGPWKGLTRVFHKCKHIGYIKIQEWNEGVREYTRREWNTRA